MGHQKNMSFLVTKISENFKKKKKKKGLNNRTGPLHGLTLPLWQGCQFSKLIALLLAP